MIHGTHNAIQDDRNNHIKIYINGEFLDRKDAKISVFDSGYLVGDGIWEAVRLYRGTLVFLDDHFSRLWSAAKATGIETQRLLDITGKFDTFEGAAEAAGKLNAVLGGGVIDTNALLMADHDENSGS